CVRCNAAVPTTSAQSTSTCVESHSAYRPACARSAAASRPETNSGIESLGVASSAAAPPFVSPLLPTARAGPSSSTTCAFVPLMPNDDTPARRTRDASLRHAQASCKSDSPLPSHSICSLGRSACNVFGKSSCCNDSTILITPSTPAAACVCPMLDFDDPNHSGRSSPRVGPNTSANAPASIGSPKLVTVPCASTPSIASQLTPLAASTAPITPS